MTSTTFSQFRRKTKPRKIRVSENQIRNRISEEEIADFNQQSKMIYDVNSILFRSFLSQKGGAADKRKTEEHKPKEQRPKANENKPVMNE